VRRRALRELEDRELEERFRELRLANRSRAPGFQEMMARARREADVPGQEADLATREAAAQSEIQGPKGPRPLGGREDRTPGRWFRRTVWAGGVLAAAAAAILFLPRLPAGSDAQFVRAVEAYSSDPAAGAWRSPTDPLLRVPGGEILSSVPTVGTSKWLMRPSPTSHRRERQG
jgi:hypothetical protein